MQLSACANSPVQNGENILQADNQFQTHNIEITPSNLKASNTLLLHFKSAALLAKSIEAKLGKVRAGSVNLGDPSRVYVRKAQYDWRCVHYLFDCVTNLIYSLPLVGIGYVVR